MPTSQNGWPANDVTRTQSYKVPGTDRALRLVKGPAGELLTLVAAWIHRNVEPISPDKEFDDWGYAERPIRGSTTTLSNHASGTAFDFNATQHPLGVAGTWSNSERTKINGMLAQLEGTVRWGDNYVNRKDGMHFEINVNDDAAGLAKINRAVATMQRLLNPKPNPQAETPAFSNNRVDLDAVEYAAKGGYFHSGQKAALDDARTVVSWLLATKVISERDSRVWETFVRSSNWAAAGLQYRGIVKRFQRKFGLVDDGVVGPKTKAKLYTQLTNGGVRVAAN